MRVNVAYSVDLEEVPDLIKNLITEVLKDFSSLEEHLAEAISSIDDENQLKINVNVEETRKKMAKMDTRLLECVNMYNGYWDALHPAPTAQLEQPNEEKENEPTKG